MGDSTDDLGRHGRFGGIDESSNSFADFAKER